MKRKIKILTFLIVFVLIITLISEIVLIVSYNKLIYKYEDKTYKNTYINGENFSDLKFNDLEDKLQGYKNSLLEKNVVFYGNDKEITLKLKDLEPILDIKDIVDKIKTNQDNYSFLDRIRLLHNNIKKDYKFNIQFEDTAIDKILTNLEKEFNSDTLNDKLYINSDHSVSVEVGHNGFRLNQDLMKENVFKYLNEKFKDNLFSDDDYKIEIVGEVVERQNSQLSTINKKISSFYTTFENSGNRGYNINLAVNKLNKTILYPGSTFSFRQIVGPYSCVNGYKEAPAQSASGSDCGGGVCQVSSTLYNAQLLAGLKTITRSNHGKAVAYVAKGRDATVYGNTTDYKFQNQYNYPICIVSYVLGNKIIIDIWSNENALGGKTYDVTTKKLASGGYATYLLVYENNSLIETRYLHTSFYS